MEKEETRKRKRRRSQGLPGRDEISLKLLPFVNRNGRLSSQKQERGRGVRKEVVFKFHRLPETREHVDVRHFNIVATISRDVPLFPPISFLLLNSRWSNMVVIYIYTPSSTRFLSMIVHLSGK